MISKSAVREFLARRLEDYSFLKDLKRSEIAGEVNDLIEERYPSFKFETKPFKHQLASFYVGACLDQFLFMLDMGLGKTKIILDLLRFRHVGTTLVLVPRDVNCEAWEEQCDIHASVFDVCPLVGTSKEKLELAHEDGNIYPISYPGLLHVLCDNKGRGKLEINRTRIKNFAKLFDALVIDEIHNAMTKSSLTFRVCNALANQIPLRYGATGTPFGRNPESIWAPCYLMDRGQTLGDNLGIFRAAYFVEKQTGWNTEYVFDETKEKDFHKALQNISMRYEDRECSDIPKEIRREQLYTLSESAKQAYNKALDGLIKAKGNYREIDNAFVRMRQICSGFLVLKDDIGKDVVRFEKNPKLELLQT